MLQDHKQLNNTPCGTTDQKGPVEIELIEKFNLRITCCKVSHLHAFYLIPVNPISLTCLLFNPSEGPAYVSSDLLNQYFETIFSLPGVMKLHITFKCHFAIVPPKICYLMDLTLPQFTCM